MENVKTIQKSRFLTSITILRKKSRFVFCRRFLTFLGSVRKASLDVLLHLGWSVLLARLLRGGYLVFL